MQTTRGSGRRHDESNGQKLDMWLAHMKRRARNIEEDLNTRHECWRRWHDPSVWFVRLGVSHVQRDNAGHARLPWEMFPTAPSEYQSGMMDNVKHVCLAGIDKAGSQSQGERQPCLQ